jgi:glucose-6-phosphate isomerase, archaeal
MKTELLNKLDLSNGIITGNNLVERRLADLGDCFADKAAWNEAVATKNERVYWVDSVAHGEGDGDLHYGIGSLMPGKVGDEYYMTKGHYHSWRDAAEIYIGLKGEGVMLLEEEETGASTLVPLVPNAVIYVPGRTAHRTINTGDQKLVYLGIYPAKAGHDYGSIADKNFKFKVIQTPNGPLMVER